MTIPRAIALLVGLSLEGLALTLSAQETTIVPSFCTRSWTGCSGLDPNDTAATHTLQRTLLNPGWTYFPVNYTNGMNWTYADAKVALNAGSKIIAGIFNTNDLTVASNAMVAVISRYTNSLYGWIAFSEPDTLPSYTNADQTTQADSYIPYVTLARGIINQLGYKGKILLAGPKLSQSYIDSYAVAMYNKGAWSNLDLIITDDYYACPGNGGYTNGMCNPDGSCTNGTCTSWSGTNCLAYSTNTFTTYYHPYNAAGGNPNLQARILDMQKWAATNNITQPVVFTEYGLYSGNVGDATYAAAIFGINHAVCIFSSPNGPMGLFPWNNGLGGGVSNAYWDAAMNAFMNQTCLYP